MTINKLSYYTFEPPEYVASRTPTVEANFCSAASLQNTEAKSQNALSAEYYSAYACSVKYNLLAIRQRGQHKKAKLTKREIECLKWASQGKTSYEIAKILGLSENTINNYVASIVRKMGASNRLHMVGIALRENYIE